MMEHLSRALRMEGRITEARAAQDGARAIAREQGDAALAAALDTIPEVDLSTPNTGGE